MISHRIVFALLLMIATTAQAADWPQWRGPFSNGSTDETNLPTSWSQTENVVWSAELPGAAASTPIVVGDRVFVSGLDIENETVVAMGFDRATGERLWQDKVSDGTRRDERSSYAACSPASDGENVFFFFASGDLVCYDFDGQRQWARNIHDDYGVFAFQWTFASSPLLMDGKLYLQVLQRDVPTGGRGFTDKENESYILAMNPADGKTLWRHVRPSGAVAESREAFSTPVPFEHNGRKELLVVGGDGITGHNPETGAELWRWEHMNENRISHWRLVPSPVAGGGVVLACAPKRGPVFAVKAGSNGTLTNDGLAWTSENVGEVSSDVPTPAFYDGDFFVLSDVRRSLSRVDPATGAVKWTIETPGRSKYEASPLAADGKIYIVNFEGEVDVINAADGTILNTIPMDQPSPNEVVRASVVAAGGRLFIRTTRRLYCVGQGE